jgi:hypothetical protein
MLGGSTVLLFIGMPVALTFITINSSVRGSTWAASPG